MSAAPSLPQGATARLYMPTVAPDRPAAWTVVVALPPVEPGPADLLRPGEIAALAFASLADALVCRRRIGGGEA